MAETDNRMLKDSGDGGREKKPRGRPKKRPEDVEPPVGIRCPKCKSDRDHYVYSTRPFHGRRRRYRACRNCGNYFTTDEDVS